MSGRKLWSREETRKLISLYEANPILWKATRKDNKTKRKKGIVLEHLAKEMNTTAGEVHRKLHILKTQFGQEVKKKNKLQKGEVFVSKWIYYELLKFTLETYKPKDAEDSTDESSGPHAIEFLDIDTPNVNDGSKKPKREPVNNGICKMEKDLNQPDEFQVFGDYVASELRSMHYLRNRGELKRLIQRDIINFTRKDDTEYLERMQKNAESSFKYNSVEDE